MIRLLPLVFFAMLSGFPAHAQTFVIRSGEHEGFTRLVLPLPDKVNWSIKRSKRTLLLKIDRPSISFDFSRVFDRIPRSRLTALSQKSPGADLVLSLGCTCSVSSSVDTPGFLVIDIRNSDDIPEPRQPIAGLPTNQPPYRFPSYSSPFGNAQLATPVLMLPTVIGQRPWVGPVTLTARPTNNQQNKPKGTINISEERLMAQINRASDQGLIELKVRSQERVTQETEPVGTDTSGTRAQSGAQDNPLPFSLSVTTAVDRDLALVAQSLDRSKTSTICIVSQRLTLNDWGGSRPFSAEIGHWRSQLFGEFDRVKPDIALNLARAYLHFGFGAEAAQTIRLISQTDEDSQIVMALAQIIDAGETNGANPFSGQQHCDGDVALWAVLSADSLAGDANDNAILLAFSRLPPQLRSYLGPRLSKRFAKLGNHEMANSILRTLMRTGTESGSGIELAKAAVAKARGDLESERQELTKSLTSGSEHSPEALVKLVTNAFSSRETVSPSIPDLAAGYALEFRNAELGPELRRAYSVSLALTGQFIAAFDTLQDIEKQDGASGSQSTLVPLVSLLTERADDVTLLRIAFNLPQETSSLVATEIGIQMARRMLDLGFSNQAARWISPPNETQTSEDLRRMRAEIALAHRRPRRAIVELLGLNGAEASRLRAAAMWQQGDYQQAGQILVAAEEFDEAARGFWLAEDWKAVPDQADAHYAQIAARSAQLRGRETEPAQLTPLAEARALMHNSSEARAEIGALLQSISIMPETLQ